MSLKDLYNARFGGASDTTALAALAAGGLLTSPFFYDPSGFAAMALGMSSAAYLTNRALTRWRESHVLDSNLTLKSAAALQKPGGLFVGYRTDTGEPVYISDDDLTRHGSLTGASGSGKTVLGQLLMFGQIQRGGGVLFVDGKMNADDILAVYQYACYCNRQDDFLVLNPGNPAMSNTYNPIGSGDSDEVSARILSLIPDTANSPGSDHYKSSANQGITTLVAALQAAKLAYNFIDLVILLMNHRAIHRLEQLLQQRAPDHPATRNLALFLEQYRGAGRPGSGLENAVDTKRMKETFGGIGGRMYQFGTNAFGEVMNTYEPEIDLYDAIMNNKIIYIALPTMGKNEAASALGKMVLGDLRTAISWVQAQPKEKRPNPPFLAFLDELGSYAVASLARPFEQARSSSISLWPAYQTMANLEAVSPEFREMVLGNTYSKVFFKVATQETAEACADLIGQTIDVTRTLAAGANKAVSNPLVAMAPEGSAGASTGLTMSEREQETYLVSPDDLKALSIGECILLHGGENVLSVRVPMLKVDPELARQFGPVVINRVGRRRDRRRDVEGINLFRNSNDYLSPRTVAQMQEQQAAVEEETPEEA